MNDHDHDYSELRCPGCIRVREHHGLAVAAISLALAHPECWEDVLRAYFEETADLDALRATAGEGEGRRG